MRRYAQALFVFTAAPACLSAHGEQALLLPIGQVAGFCAVLVAVFLLKMSRVWRMAFVLSAIAAIVGSWFIPSLYFVFLDWFGTSAWPWFAFGLLAPIGVASAVYAASRSVSRRNQE